ncbi:MAG TPA: substrate-binding domain-containing protein [Rhizobium sp.]
MRLFQDDFFDGVVMVSDLPGHEALCDHLDRMGKAHVTLCGGLTGPRPAVLTDDRLGMRLLFDHLTALGHRHIAFVYRISRVALSDRRSIFREMISESAGALEGDVISFERAEIDREAFREMLASPATRPTALVCGSDGLAIEVVALLRELGMRIPADISVVGYDNVPDTAFWAPPLTTVAQRDLNIVQTIVILITATMVSANLLIDFLYILADPRLRHRAAA